MAAQLYLSSEVTGLIGRFVATLRKLTHPLRIAPRPIEKTRAVATVEYRLDPFRRSLSGLLGF